MSKPTSPFTIIILVTIFFAKESAITKRGLTRWHWKGIWVFFRVVSIFLMAGLTAYYAKSVIYIMSLDIIGEAITTIAEFDGVKVY